MMLTKLNIRGVLPPRVTKYLSTTTIIHQDQRQTTSRKIRIKNEEKREIEQRPVRPRQRDNGPGNNNHRYGIYRMPEQEGKRIIEIRIPHLSKIILVIFFNPLSLIFYLMVYEAGPKELFDAISEEYQDWKDKK